VSYVMEDRLKALEEGMELLNNKMTTLLMLCLQQGTDMQEMAEALEEVIVVVNEEKTDMMSSLASEIQKARKSPLN
jgi:hypothetical protein